MIPAKYTFTNDNDLFFFAIVKDVGVFCKKSIWRVIIGTNTKRFGWKVTTHKEMVAIIFNKFSTAQLLIKSSI